MKEENIHKLLKDFIFFFSHSPHPSDLSGRYPPLRSLSQSLHHPLVSPFSPHPSDLSGRYPLHALSPGLSLAPSYPRPLVRSYLSSPRPSAPNGRSLLRTLSPPERILSYPPHIY